MIISHCLEASKKIIFRLLSLFGIRLPIICNLLLNKKVKSDVHVLRRIIGTIIQVGGLLCTGGCTHNWPLSKRRLIINIQTLYGSTICQWPLNSFFPARTSCLPTVWILFQGSLRSLFGRYHIDEMRRRQLHDDDHLLVTVQLSRHVIE